MKRKGKSEKELHRQYLPRKNFEDLFDDLGIRKDIEYSGCSKLPIIGRNIRYLPEMGIVQIGDNDFDRWANSVELEFFVWQSKGIRQFVRWLNENCVPKMELTGEYL